ncbi:hypothetical protein SUGI_0406330 [Cryptomeria japonica]|uniref:GDSL esterase/lipase At5g45670 n=1 Tax=Cryptomeria japonica TaxID=3369 RepID=UPI002408DA6A|nr:GDSL esterase/lipase At5g45670 [Cryptomeria japonica]GLJ21773.1 hypothetical protein SUGI_0406330 [Cryptomeria japonica]
MGAHVSSNAAAVLVTYLFLIVGVHGEEPQVPALFIFGDSITDNGNNNYITTLAKANFFPYGIDFEEGRATGRFCNGMTTVDVLAKLLGLPLIPPYAAASTKGVAVMNGVNYASGAAGILDETGRNLLGRVTFNEQIANFGNTVNDITSHLGSAEEVAEYLSKSIFAITFGSNDYINNYLVPGFYSSSRTYTSEDYSDLLISHFSQQLVKLYNLGARKFAVAAVGPLGCLPSQLPNNINGSSTCVDRVNQEVSLFNSKLKHLLRIMEINLPGAHFVYGDAYSSVTDIINNPTSYGFIVTNQGCCGIGRNNGQISCLPGVFPCPKRNQYVFWDSFHPTEAVNIIVATKAYNGSLYDASPINIKELAQL